VVSYAPGHSVRQTVAATVTRHENCDISMPLMGVRV